MNDVHRVLRKLMPPLDPVLGFQKTLDVTAAAAALDRVARNSDRTFWVLIGMICVLFVLQVFTFVFWAADPSKAAAVAGMSGVSLPFLLYFLRDSWRTKVQADTLLVLVGTLDAAVVQSVVRAFLEGINNTSAARKPAATTTV